MPVMQSLQPCARCEQELPEAFFDSRNAVFCNRCSEEAHDILQRKYSVIEAAYFRAQLRHSSRQLQKRIDHAKRRTVAAAGD